MSAPAPANSNNPTALGAIGAVLFGVGLIVYLMQANRGPASVTVAGNGVAVTVPVNTGPSASEMAAAQAQYDRDRDAMRRQKPQTEAEVERVLRRRADQCITQGDTSYCHRFYATKPPIEGRTVLAVAFKNGRVIITDM